MSLEGNQGLKLKKTPQVAFWRPTVEIQSPDAIFLVANLYNVNDAAHGIRASDI